jgi:hypothetical protein
LRMCVGGRGAPQATLSGALATFVALAVPDEGGWMGVPACDGVVEPGDELVLRLGMMPLECTTDEDALDRLSEPMLLHIL